MSDGGKTILVMGTFDTKGPEHAFVREQILKLGAAVITLNTGVLGSTDLFPVDVEAEAVTAAVGEDLRKLRAHRNRGHALRVMCRGASALVRRLYDDQQFAAVIGLGGGSGTTITLSAMRALPAGLTKVLVSTVAEQGQRENGITVIWSIVDIAGINRVSRKVFARAAAVVCGVSEDGLAEREERDKPAVAASMFGNTTPCVDRCRSLLGEKGYEVLVFHAVGSGGRAMEDMAAQGQLDGVLDITTTEWADELCGGILGAGPGRLDGPGKAGIAHLIVPGCLDMVNFGPPNTVPERYKDRLLYEWNPSVTLMRTSPEENVQLGKILAEKANASRGPVALLLPLRGLSMLDQEGEVFWDPEADQALFQTIKEHVRDGIAVSEQDVPINDPLFAERAVEQFLQLSETR